jgi:hypothetical protein
LGSIRKAASVYLRKSWTTGGLPRDEYNKVFTAGWEMFLEKERKELSKKYHNVAVRAFKKAGISPHQDMPEEWLNAANTIGLQNDMKKGVTVDDTEKEDLVIGQMKDGTILSVNRAIHNALFEFLGGGFKGEEKTPKRKRNAVVASKIGVDCTREDTIQDIRKQREDKEAEEAAKEERKKVRLEQKVEKDKQAAAEAERKKLEKAAKVGARKKLVDDAVDVIRPLIQDGEVSGDTEGEVRNSLIEAGITRKAVSAAKSAMTPKFMEGVWSSDEKEEAEKWLDAAKTYL